MAGRSGQNNHTRGASGPEDAGILEAVEELIGAFGLSGFMAACLKSSAGERFEKVGGNGTLRMAQVILRQIVAEKNPRLQAEVMALGVGLLSEEGTNMTRIAAKYGISKQALSKRVVQFCDENGLPPSCYMRSKQDRRTYALTNQPRTA